MLDACGCRNDFIQVQEGFSRINVKIKAEQESEINGQGPHLSPQNLQDLFSKLENLSDGDGLVLAGSIPNTLPADIYEKILEHLQGRNIHAVVDATGELLRKVLKYQPFLIKPNNHELGELFGQHLTTDEAIISHAQKLQQMGARNVLVSMAGDGAILVDEGGGIHKRLPPQGHVVNSVGAGTRWSPDSLPVISLRKTTKPRFRPAWPPAVPRPSRNGWPAAMTSGRF